MAAGLDPLVAFWKEWGILALVLLSFVLQVILLVTAEIRRLKDSGVLKVVVWSAYLMADTTAIYVLGHMSVTSTTSQELTAFWAPFLLLHLGGQDNITAYSIEDNRLWLRHLQSFVIQVLAAAYVLYQSSIVARRTLLRPAAILMFIVGVVKYGERVCALKLACSGGVLSGKNYKSAVNEYSMDPDKYFRIRGEEKYAQAFRAHALLHFSEIVMKGPSSAHVVDIHMDKESHWEHMYEVAEVQMSLMHDVLYSKAELIHTWYGYCIRVFSLLATVTALLLFSRFSFPRNGYIRADVAATYVLLAGAIFLEITSVLRAMFSTWAYGKIIRERLSVNSFRVARALARLSFWSHELARSALRRGGVTARYWSRSMGQYNFIYMCSNCKDSRGSKITRWMGREDWWNTMVYTSSVPVSPYISQLLKNHIKKTECIHLETSSVMGRAALKRMGLYEELSWIENDVLFRLEDGILVWHMATHLYLSWYEAEHPGQPHHLAQVTRELSNYMMFLVVARPYMLSGIYNRVVYVDLCYDVMNNCKYSSEEDLLRVMRVYGDAAIAPDAYHGLNDIFRKNPTFSTACKLGSKLISKEKKTLDANMLEVPAQKQNMLEVISQVWVDLLWQAANQCSPDSHARQLSNGGEMITLVEVIMQYAVFPNFDLFRQDIDDDSMADSTTAPGNEDV